MKRQTVLVIDDSPEMLAIIGGILKESYNVKVARSAARALLAAVTQPLPDLILLDVMMPDMDGYSLIKQIRLEAGSKLDKIPVIFVSAMTSSSDEEQGLSLGAVDYITKPIRPAVLLARVRIHLELKQARDRLRNQNSYLEAEIERRMLENEMVKEASLQALAMIAETRDHDTGNHLQRTQSYIQVLARRLALNPRYARELYPAQIKAISKAALLHDLGKVGIPDSILLKTGKLTAAEYEIMKTHPTLGSRAIKIAISRVVGAKNANSQSSSSLAALAFLEIASQIAATHHERWDGSGYPHGLAGDDIPLAGQLMALADVYDALISRRVYKTPMDEEEVVRIICEGRGTHFNPELVDAFMEEREAFQEIAHYYADQPKNQELAYA